MGVVYEALDTDRNETVALKTLQRLEPHEVYLFKQEFRSLANIVHHNLVPLYELISDGEQWFFTMEAISDGMDVLSWVRGADAPLINLPAANSSRVWPADHQPLLEAESALSADAAAPERAPIDNIDPDAPTLIQPGSATGDESEQPVSTTGSTSRVGPALDYDRVHETLRQITDGVGALHLAGKLHRDLKPANTLVRQDGNVVLLDFGLVADLNQGIQPDTGGGVGDGDAIETSHYATNTLIAGTVGYMSPEQADARLLTPASDWYSLGVILFQMLTGRLPFSGTTQQVLQAKQSQSAPSPSDWVDGIPQHLDALCTDLLKRDPAQRPTEADIRARLTGVPGADTVAKSAESDPVQQPFIGRHQELEELHRALNRVGRGETLVCRVHGHSGTGKSALIEQFLSQCGRSFDVTIISGRCYEQESVPYKAIDGVIDALTRKLLRLPQDGIESLLPDDVSSLARIFPVLNRLEAVSARPDSGIAMTDMREFRGRAFDALKILFYRLSKQSDLVIYIDDLQWGDVDSAALLARLIQAPNAPRMLLLLAYRSEYEESSSCLQALLSQTNAMDGASQLELEVGALPPAQSDELIETLIGQNHPELLDRMDWIRREASGSTYFLYELVRHLKSGLDADEINTVSLDDVLWQRVQRLADKPRSLLEVTAVSGQPVRLRNAREATGIDSLPPQVVALLRHDNLVRTTGPSLDDQIETFHDRIRESIVDKLPDSRRLQWHGQLALSLEQAGDADPDTLALHFDRSGQAERASPYYLQAANHAAQVLAFERAEELYLKAAQTARSDIARAEVQEKLIHFYTDMTRFEDAYALAQDAILPFGVKFPSRFVPPLFAAEFIHSKVLMGRLSKPDLLNLPTSKDDSHTWAIRLGTACAKAAYQIRPELCIALCTRLVNLCLKNGNTADCAVSYMAYGAIFHGGILGWYKAGADYGRLALDLVEKYQCEQQRAEVNFVVGYFGTSWLKPATEAEALWKVAHDSGLQTNDLFHTGCASAATIMSYHMRGVPMDQVLEKSEGYLEFLRKAQLLEPIGCVQVVQQTIRNLRGQTRSRSSLSDDSFDEQLHVEALESYGSRHLAHYYYICKMQLAYLWGDYPQAQQLAESSATYLRDSPGMLHSAEHHFYYALVQAALLSSASQKHLGSATGLRRAHKKLRHWAARNEHNFLHKERLLAAERARLARKPEQAWQEYDAAIAAASQHGYLQIEGLAGLCASRLAREHNDSPRAEAYLTHARQSFDKWGARHYSMHGLTH